MQSMSTVTVETIHGEVTIPLGKVTPEVIDAYMYGQCWALARAISDYTGWPMVWIYAPLREVYQDATPEMKIQAEQLAKRWNGQSIVDLNIPDFRNFVHALVRTPDDKFIDIEGVGTAAEKKGRYAALGGCAFLEVPSEMMDQLGFKRKLHMEAASQLVPVVLAQTGYANSIFSKA